MVVKMFNEGVFVFCGVVQVGPTRYSVGLDQDNPFSSMAIKMIPRFMTTYDLVESAVDVAEISKLGDAHEKSAVFKYEPDDEEDADEEANHSFMKRFENILSSHKMATDNILAEGLRFRKENSQRVLRNYVELSLRKGSNVLENAINGNRQGKEKGESGGKRGRKELQDGNDDEDEQDEEVQTKADKVPQRSRRKRRKTVQDDDDDEDEQE
eukprot:TRINITY_DN689_c0_g4_i2.p1 TRINITY_DN689_c0_g4~~TRINITY_DN689_c0_g4_i2.p1  ORF type:complete len:211 (-),score=90.30 TRINITY_DN689_c0_g4_i2:205-837(-)